MNPIEIHQQKLAVVAKRKDELIGKLQARMAKAERLQHNKVDICDEILRNENQISGYRLEYNMLERERFDLEKSTNLEQLLVESYGPEVAKKVLAAARSAKEAS